MIKIKSINKNYIPDMVHPYGKSWNQPDRKNIVIDDEHAAMSKSDFSKLSNYSHSIPSGVYEGKMWKGEYRDGGWYLAWFGLSQKEGSVSNNVRKIILID